MKYSNTKSKATNGSEYTRRRRQSERIKFRVLIPLVLALCVLTAVFAFAFWRVQQKEQAENAALSAQEVERWLRAEENQKIAVLKTTIEAVMNDGQLAEALRKRNRAALLERVKPLFASLRSEHAITHLYFHLPDRTVLLRVHDPGVNGDKIDRPTMLKAEKTGKVSVGFERGLTGIFTLRVVSPWRQDGQLLGYLELGVEFENIVKDIHKQLNEDFDFVVAVDKKLLDREQWADAMKSEGRTNDWSQFSRMVVINKTVETLPKLAVDYLLGGNRPKDSWREGNLQMVFLRLTDVTGIDIGELIILNNVAKQVAETSRSIQFVVVVSLAGGAVVIIFFYFFLTGLENDLSEQTAKLKTEIAEREQAEAALRQSKDQYQRLFESNPYPAWVYDLETLSFLLVNTVAIHHYGYSRDEFQAMTIKDIRPAEDIPRLIANLAAPRKSLGNAVVWRHRKKDGTLIDVEIISHPLDHDGRRAAFVMAIDITERKWVEERIEWLSRFPSENPNPVLRVSARGVLEYANAASDILLRTMGAEVGGAVNAELQARIGETLAKEHPVNIEFQAGDRTFGVTLAPVVNRGYVNLYAIDITESKQAESAVRVSEEEFRSLAEAMPQMVWITRPDGWNIYFSQQWMDYTGLTLEESLGHGWNKPFHPEDRQRAWNAWQQATATIGTYSVECRLRRADGTYRWWLIRGVPQRDASDNVLKWFGTCTDIHESKQAQEKLRETNEYLENLFNYATAPIIVWDAKFMITRLNHAFESLTGKKAGEVIGGPLDLLFPPASAESSMELIRQTSGGKRLEVVEINILHLDGSVRTVIWNSTTIYSEDGKTPVASIAQGQDITARKRAEEALRESEVRYRALFDGSADGILVADLETRTFKYANSTLCRMLGYAEDELQTMGVPDIHPKDALQSVVAEFEAQARGEKALAANIPCLRKDGSVFYADIGAVKITIDGWPCIAGFFRDITERKKLETQVEQLRIEHAGILNSIGEGVHWIDIDGLIKFENPAAAKMLGYEVSELIGKPAHSTMHHTRADGAAYPQSECPICATLRDGVLHRVTDEVFLRKGGASFAVEYICTPVYDKNGRSAGSVVIFTDTTERKCAQAELENVHKQLVEASRRGGMAEIATNVLHNIGNVLNSVNVSAGLIVESVKKSRASSLARVVVLLQEHARDLGAFITNDARGKHVPAHLAQLSKHLMADQEAIVSELDSLQRNVEHIKEIVAVQQNYVMAGGVKEMINVVNLVEDSLRMREDSLSRHRVEVIREFENVPPMNVEKHKIVQILVNLLRNAEHACQGSDRAYKRLTVRVADGDGRVKISVIDNGIGIPLENLIRIFNYGFTTRKGGHGFGLHSGALAAREMGGSLTVHSDGPGQGAAFTLELPLPNAGELT